MRTQLHRLLFLLYAIIPVGETLGQTNQLTNGLPCRLRDSTEIFTKLDVYPEFKGGEKAWYDYVQSKVRDVNVGDVESDSVYMDSMQIHFAVDKDSRMCLLTVTGGRSALLRAAVERLMRESPKWVPGSISGRYLVGYKTLQLMLMIRPGHRGCAVIRRIDDYYFDQSYARGGRHG